MVVFLRLASLLYQCFLVICGVSLFARAWRGRVNVVRVVVWVCIIHAAGVRDAGVRAHARDRAISFGC